MSSTGLVNFRQENPAGTTATRPPLNDAAYSDNGTAQMVFIKRTIVIPSLCNDAKLAKRVCNVIVVLLLFQDSLGTWSPPFGERLRKPSADYMKQSERGRNNTEALCEAAWHGDLPRIAELLRKGANVNAHAASGEVALHFAVQRRHFRVAKLLLDSGARVDVKRLRSGVQSIHVAAMVGAAEIIVLLLERGARVSAITDFGSTVWQFYLGGKDHWGSKRILEYDRAGEVLRAYGADGL